MKSNRTIHFTLLALLLASFVAMLALGSCDIATPIPKASPTPTPAAPLLYMTDTNNGKIYTYSSDSLTASSSALLSTGKSATSEISFYQGIGYVTAGYSSGGLYWFDPAATVPSSTRIGASCSAQYVAFYSTTKAYVTVADYTSSANNGVYQFNPADRGTALVPLVATIGSSKYPQEIILGSDGMIWVANNNTKGDTASVSRIDPATDTVTATITTTKGGTTGLYAGSYNGTAGVFVANVSGSIDFVANNAAGGTIASAVTGSGSNTVYATRVVQLANGNLVATGYDTSWANHSYLVTLNGTTASSTELKVNGAAFGGGDIAVQNGLIYIPVTDYTSSQLYIFDSNGTQASNSPLPVMQSGTDAIANIGFFQN